ncbi:isopenicillin N synthase family oxygenase [Streptomyces eurocidicus]|nr:isopenicillin N synthase family oxygenase [Streptomyces eurocidicus]
MHTNDHIALIDLQQWRDGGPRTREEVAARLDTALRAHGFCLITGHGLPRLLRSELRSLARVFFTLPAEVKERYTAGTGGSGWSPALPIAPGRPPDLKETFSFRSGGSTGSQDLDDRRSERWPAEVPRLQDAAGEFLRRMRALSDELLSVCAVALGAAPRYFEAFRRDPTHAGALKWYPSLRHLGPTRPGQHRVGPHTDLGALTVIDREFGLGGLQLETADRRWLDAPCTPETLSVTVGELLSRWSGDRWPACRHRVAPPPAEVPEEDLLSLLYVSGADHDALIESFPPPVGTTAHPPVRWGDYLRANLTAQR